MRKTILFMFFTSLLFIVSCKKNDDNVMPPYSETGEDMLAFKANGEVWKYKSYFSTMSTLNVFVGDSGSFSFYAQKKSGSTINIYLPSYLSDTGKYILDIKINKKISVFFRWENQEYHYYSLDSTHTGYIQINKYDTINKIIAGKFEIDLIGKNNEEMKITEGQFDFIYN